MNGRLEMPQADVALHPGWLLPADADRIFAALAAEAAWKQEHLTIQGRTIPLPRLTAWHGTRSYRYSGIANAPQPWTPVLAELRDRLEAFLGASFNSVLCNRYRDGRDSVAWHADDEPELGMEPVIASISLGQARKFSFKRRDGAGARVDLTLEHGALLIMRGPTQRHWLHQVPKTTQPLAPRINLTYRRIV